MLIKFKDIKDIYQDLGLLQVIQYTILCLFVRKYNDEGKGQ